MIEVCKIQVEFLLAVFIYLFKLKVQKILMNGRNVHKKKLHLRILHENVIHSC